LALSYQIRPVYCTSLFHLLGCAGNPFGTGPLEPGLEPEPSTGGAGRMGKFMTLTLEVLGVREDCEGRRGAASASPFATLCLGSFESRFEGGDRSRSFSLMVAAGAAGARWDLRLLCSIMDMAHASRSTGVRLAAWRKASCSYSSLGVGRSAGSFIRHFAIISSRIDGKASLLGSFGEGSRTICCRRSRIPWGPPA